MSAGRLYKVGEKGEFYSGADGAIRTAGGNHNVVNVSITGDNEEVDSTRSPNWAG